MKRRCCQPVALDGRKVQVVVASGREPKRPFRFEKLFESLPTIPALLLMAFQSLECLLLPMIAINYLNSQIHKDVAKKSPFSMFIRVRVFGLAYLPNIECISPFQPVSYCLKHGLKIQVIE
jgi:hypothetical protein